MIFPCLNMRLQKLLWAMVRQKSGNWQIMLQPICSTMESKTDLQNLDLSEQCKYSVQQSYIEGEIMKYGKIRIEDGNFIFPNI